MTEGNPAVGDRVRVKDTNLLGTVEYLENHKFDVALTIVGVRYDNFAHALGEGGEFFVTEIEREEDA